MSDPCGLPRFAALQTVFAALQTLPVGGIWEGQRPTQPNRRGSGGGAGDGDTGKGEQGRGKILEPLDILDAGAPTEPCACFVILF